MHCIILKIVELKPNEWKRGKKIFHFSLKNLHRIIHIDDRLQRGNLFDADIDVTNFTVILGKVYSVGPRDPVSWSHRGLNLIPNRVYNYTWQAIFMCWARFLSIVSHGLNSTTRLAYRLNSPRKHSAFLAALYLEALWNVSPNEFAYSFAVLNRPIKKKKKKKKGKRKKTSFFFTSNVDVVYMEVKKKRKKKIRFPLYSMELCFNV